jgi:hypothetical protein
MSMGEPLKQITGPFICEDFHKLSSSVDKSARFTLDLNITGPLIRLLWDQIAANIKAELQILYE